MKKRVDFRSDLEQKTKLRADESRKGASAKRAENARGINPDSVL